MGDLLHRHPEPQNELPEAIEIVFDRVRRKIPPFEESSEVNYRVGNRHRSPLSL